MKNLACAQICIYFLLPLPIKIALLLLLGTKLKPKDVLTLKIHNLFKEGGVPIFFSQGILGLSPV
jgi:hypothetical protein